MNQQSPSFGLALNIFICFQAKNFDEPAEPWFWPFVECLSKIDDEDEVDDENLVRQKARDDQNDDSGDVTITVIIKIRQITRPRLANQKKNLPIRKIFMHRRFSRHLSFKP